MERKARARSKSSSRKTGKSPGRAKKAPARSPSARGRPPKRKEEKKDVKPRVSSRSRSRSVSVGKRRSSRSRRSSKKDDSPESIPSVVLNDIAKDISRQQSISKQLDEIIRRSMSRELAADNARRTTRQSVKSSAMQAPTKVSPTKAPSKLKVEAGWAVALIQVVALTAIVGSALLGCTKDQCELKPFHIPRNWRVYFKPEAAILVLGFTLLQTILSILPIGRVVKSLDGNSSYRANGLLALILTGSLVAGAWYLKYPVTQIYELWIPAAVTSAITALVLGVGLWIKGGRAPVPGLNAYGNSGNFVIDVIAGREVNPILFKTINVKVVLFRICIIGSILSDILLLLKGYEVRREVSPTLATLVALKSLYYLDGLWFEEALSSTFEMQYEGTGLLTTLGYFLYPFLAGVSTRFILQQRVELPTYCLALSVLIYLVGFTVYRASNLQKAAYRKNPFDPAIAHLQTINTARGKKLLVSGWWGKVKHPNYLGDIILHWAVASIAGFTHAIPYVLPLITTLFLIHRAARDDKRCKERYQGAWTEYHKRVPYRIVPRIY